MNSISAGPVKKAPQSRGMSAMLRRLAARRSYRLTAGVFALAAGAVLTAGSASAASITAAAPITKANNTDNLNLTTSWQNGVVPGATDTAVWDSTVTSANSTILGGPLTWGQIRVLNPGGGVTVGADGNTLTLNGVNGVGIDMSQATQDLTFNAAFALGAAQTWVVASGRTLAVGGTLDNGGNTLTIGGSGNVSFNTAASLISGTGGLVKNGNGGLTLAAVNTYGGDTAINNGLLTLDLATANSANAAGGTFNIIPGSLSVGGGTVSAIGGPTNGGGSRTPYIINVGTLNVNAGATNFTQKRGSSARVIETFNAANRAVGGTVNYTDSLNGSGTNNANSGGYRMNPSANVNGVVPYATYTTSSTNTSWFVAVDTSNNGKAYSAFTASTATSLGSDAQNVDVVTDVAVPTGGGTVNTLRFNDSTAGRTVTIGAGDTLTIGAAGILVTNPMGNNTAKITGGTLEGGNPGSGSGQDLIIIQNDSPMNGANALFQIDSTIADNTSATALTKSGVGTLALTNTANTYTGNTYLNGGITQIAADGSLGAATSSLVFSGGTLQLGSGFSGGSLSATRGMVVNDTGGTLDTNGNNVAYGGTISAGNGSGGFTKAGAGTLTLTGNNSYTGPTTVTGGTLALSASSNNISGSTTIIVGDTPADSAATLDVSGVTGGFMLGTAQTLTGTGTVTGAVTAGGTTNAGGVGAVGTLTTGADTFLSGSTLVFDFGNNAVDELVSTGAVTGLNNAAFVFLPLAGSTGLTGSSYTLVSALSLADGSPTGSVFGPSGSASALPGSVSGLPSGYQLQYNGNQLNLVQVAAAPEPSQFAAFGLGLLGLGGLVLRARRRTAQSA